MTKRRRPTEEYESDSDDFIEGSSLSAAVSDSEVDISSALTGRKKAQRLDYHTDEEDVISNEDDFEELEGLIKESVLKRDRKEGTKLLKKTKGKTKIAKGEVGGGSFQSMGAYPVSS